MIKDVRKFLDRLLDENDWDILEMVNDREERAFFEQVSLIPESEKTMYAILQPVDQSGNDIGDEIVFSFSNADTSEVAIDVVTDPYVIRDVYDEYKRLRSSDEGFGEEEFEDYEDYYEDEEYGEDGEGEDDEEDK